MDDRSRRSERSSSGRGIDPRANAYSDIDGGGWDTLPPVSRSSNARARSETQAQAQPFIPRSNPPPPPLNDAYITPPPTIVDQSWTEPQQRAMYDQDQDQAEDEDEYVPPVTEAPPPGGSYIPWQGVQ
jgi:hypothetical protein